MRNATRVRVVLEVPSTHDPRHVITDLESWLTRYGGTVIHWHQDRPRLETAQRILRDRKGQR